jgi:hypothetical protein
MATVDRNFVREHHVHYEVEPEEVLAPDRREVTGYRVRIFATHGEEKLEDPTCERCVALRGELQEFAQALAPAGAQEDAVEVVSGATPRIYESAEVPDADEVHVTLRVLCATPEHRREPAERERRCLGAITHRLAELGVPRR